MLPSLKIVPRIIVKCFYKDPFMIPSGIQFKKNDWHERTPVKAKPSFKLERADLSELRVELELQGFVLVNAHTEEVQLKGEDCLSTRFTFVEESLAKWVHEPAIPAFDRFMEEFGWDLSIWHDTERSCLRLKCENSFLRKAASKSADTLQPAT